MGADSVLQKRQRFAAMALFRKFDGVASGGVRSGGLLLRRLGLLGTGGSNCRSDEKKRGRKRAGKFVHKVKWGERNIRPPHCNGWVGPKK